MATFSFPASSTDELRSWNDGRYNMGLGNAALALFRGCRHTQMSWPMRYDYQYSYRVCTDCGIKRLFRPDSFRYCGRYGYDIHELIARERARRMKRAKGYLPQFITNQRLAAQKPRQ